jgi:hypothetical protein
VVSTFDDLSRSRVAAVRYVLLPRLRVASQEDAGRAVAQEDDHRVVVDLAMTSANAPALKSIAAKLRANYGRCSAGEKDRR